MSAAPRLCHCARGDNAARREEGRRRPQAGARSLRQEDEPFYGKVALKIGLRCEKLWQELYEHNHFGFHRIDDKRPQARKAIIRKVAEEFGESPRMVDKLWDDYRRWLRDTA